MDPYTSYTRAGPDRPTSPYAEYFTDSSSSSDGSRTSIAEFPRVRHRRRLRSPSRLLSPEGSMPRTRTRSRVRSRPTRRETSRSLSPSANSYDWQINSGNKDRDYTIHLDLEAALDISEDIERLAQLSRLGRFNEAIVLFKERLALHVDFFPVVAEYADLLLEQGNFRDLHQFVSNRLSDPHVEYTQEGYTLLELLKRLAEVHTKGALLPVLETTLITLKSFEFRSDLLPLWFRPPTGVQIQIIDACLRIVAYAAAHSSYLENHIFQPLLHWTFFNNQLRFLSFDDDILSRPSPRPSHYSDPQPDTKPLRRLQIEQGPAGHRPYSRRNRSQPNYPQIGDWYRLLVQKGHLWESHRVLRSMLALLGDAHGHYIANGGFEDFAQLDDLTKVTTAFMHRKEGSSTSEQLLLTNLANASLLASFLAHSNDKAVRKAQVHISEEARSLASTMLSNSKQLINSRPYLYWLLFQGTRGVRGDNQVHRQGLVPGIWPQSSISRVQFLKQKDTNISSRADIAGSDIHPRKSLEIVLASAKHNEDYDLQQAALRRFCRVFQRFDQCIQAVQDLALLCDDTMQDSTGHLQCLVDECLLLDSVGSSSTEGLYTNLHRRLSEFDRSFPSHFNHSPSVRQGVEIKFFDNPLLEWTKRKTLSLLLGSIGRDTEAQLSKAQLPLVERHLPRHMSPLLNIPNTCSGCEYCGGKEGLQAPLTAGANTRAPEPSFDRGLYRASHFRPFSDLPPPRPPLAIANESYRPSTPGDDMGAVVERLMAGVRDEKKAKKTERREQEQRQKRLAESKGNLGNAEEGKKFKIKGPQGPQGPAFVLSFNLFRTYEATTSDIRILSPEIDKCGYYFTGPDGNLISHHNWDFIQPGWVLTMHLNTPKEENISQSPEKTDEPDVNNDPENPEKEKDNGNNVESDRNEAQDGNEKAPSAKRGDEDRAPY